MKKYQAYLATIILSGLIGCQQQGPVEKAGERLDEAIDNVQHGDSPFKKKGPMEKLGESVDDAVKQDEKNN